ncbi:MAG: hypothetical protein WC329_04515 [Candidatus Omnitrophota bacterium]
MKSILDIAGCGFIIKDNYISRHCNFHERRPSMKKAVQVNKKSKAKKQLSRYCRSGRVLW